MINVNWEKMGRAINLSVWISSNRITWNQHNQLKGLMNDIHVCTNSRTRLSQNSMDAIMHLVKEGKETLTDNDLDKLVEMFKEQHK
jgi:hypothetical protein